MRSRIAPIVLVLLALVVGGASYYVTDVRQAEEEATLRDSRRAAELLTARVEDLLVQESTSDEAAEAALSRWHSRYKYIPREQNSADVLEYLESLTKQGFDAFDTKFSEPQVTPDFSTYTIDVSGVGRYESLYHLIWHLENNREFYRVSDLDIEYTEESFGTGENAPIRDLVRFTFQITSYFGGIEGISAPEDDLAPVPVGLLLPHLAQKDIFAPIVRVPKNTPTQSVESPAPAPAPAPPPAQDRAAAPADAAPAAPADRRPEGLDVERATLKLLIGGQAVFEDVWGREFRVGVGDAVEGGEVIALEPRTASVRVRLGTGSDAREVTKRLGQAPAGR